MYSNMILFGGVEKHIEEILTLAYHISSGADPGFGVRGGVNVERSSTRARSARRSKGGPGSTPGNFFDR